MRCITWSLAALLVCPASVHASAPRGGKMMEPQAQENAKALAPEAHVKAGEAKPKAKPSKETIAAMSKEQVAAMSQETVETIVQQMTEDVADVTHTKEATDVGYDNQHTADTQMHTKVAADAAPHATVVVKTHEPRMVVAADGSVLRSSQDSDSVDDFISAAEENVGPGTETPASVARSGTKRKKKDEEEDTTTTVTPIPFPNDPTPVQDWQMAIGLSLGGCVLLVVGAFAFYSNRVAKRNGLPDLGQYSCFIAAIIMGFMNNLNYVVLMSRAPALAAFFKQEAWGASFPLLMVGACLAGTFMNAVHFLQVPFRTRVGLVCGSVVLGHGILVYATGDVSIPRFLLALGACVLIGLATIIGELCSLSFLRDFPSVILGGFGIGTGLAAILGPALMVGLTHGLGHHDGQIFGYLLPAVIIYWLAFMHLHSKIEFMRAVYIARGERCYPPPEEPGRRVSPSSTEMLYKTSFGIILCAALASFFEFFMYPGLLDRSDGCTNFSQFPVRHGLTVSWLSFHVGVTLSRASIALFQVERLWVFPALQFLNLVALIVARSSIFSHPLAAMAWMAWIGIIGGCTYANTMHALQTWREIPSNLRELAMTVTMMMMMVAITAATLLTKYLPLVPLFSSLISASSTSLPQGCAPVFS